MKTVDQITNCLITKVLQQGGRVLALNQTEEFEVVGAEDGKITLQSNQYDFSVGEKMSIIYLPKYASPYCTGYDDADGDGIIDLVDVDADGDGVRDPYIPLMPSMLLAKAIYKPNDGIVISVETSPNRIAFSRAREWGKPLTIDGYYPLYVTEAEALWASPMAEPFAHPHLMSEEHDGITYQWQYWMPHGVNQWHGNYATCKPFPVETIDATSVETYDWEYVDRTMIQKRFSSIVPYDYRLQLLGVDTDENGTFDAQEQYALIKTYNYKDVLDEAGNIIEFADFKHAHYITSPQQVWTYEVTAKDTSENVLPDGHSFAMGNHVLHLETYTKFDVGTQDALEHTKSKFSYYSTLANGNNATLNARTASVIIYRNAETWEKLHILEVNSEGYLVVDVDIFNVGDRIYIYVEDFPNEPLFVDAIAQYPPNEVVSVDVTKLPQAPTKPPIIIVRELLKPQAPHLVEAQTGTLEQFITWEQF
jgi:hypothetical protein